MTDTLLERLPARCVATSRLRLRTPASHDLPGLLPIFQDPETVAHTWFVETADHRWTAVSLLQLFERQAFEELTGHRVDWVCHLADAHETVIGRCALFRMEAPETWELGITISTVYQGAGYGEEATRAMLRFAWKTLAAREVILQVLPENVRMQGLCAKLGLALRTPAQHATPAGPLTRKHDHYVVDAQLLTALCDVDA